ncbi:MAG: hypothetical protein ACRD07_06830 [Acidimicrobiales bacterium]
MRTTIELTDEQHQALAAIAARRKLRGFSTLVQEAVDDYLQAHADEAIAAALALRGSISDDEARMMRQHIAEMWGSAWRAPA